MCNDVNNQIRIQKLGDSAFETHWKVGNEEKMHNFQTGLGDENKNTQGQKFFQMD